MITKSEKGHEFLIDQAMSGTVIHSWNAGSLKTTPESQQVSAANDQVVPESTNCNENRQL
jgi:hypothetical protein